MQCALLERIAIMIHDGGLDEAEAQRLACQCTAIAEAPAENGTQQQLTLIEPDYKQSLKEFYRKR